MFKPRLISVIYLFAACRNLQDDEDCKKYLMLNPETRDLYQKCQDGILFW